MVRIKEKNTKVNISLNVLDLCNRCEDCKNNFLNILSLNNDTKDLNSRITLN